MDALISAFVLLFIVVDPLGVAAIFAALTHECSHEERWRLALRGVLLAALILVSFFFIGNELLPMLGIGIAAFRIAGGVLLFMLALDMVFVRHTGLRSTTVREQHEAEHKDDISVFPLAFPLLAGPGALTTILLMSSSGNGATFAAGILGTLLVVLLVTFAVLVYAPRILALLGETGVNVVSRLLGLLLAALAVQFMLDGIRAGLFTPG